MDKSSVKQIKLLYIEDDINNRILVKNILHSKGFDFFEAEDGISGIELAEKENFDLILLDINLSGMNGYEIATRLRSMDKYLNIPIIAITANIQKKSKQRALISGCSGFITKPLDASKFYKRLEEYLNGKQESIPTNEIASLIKEFNIEIVNHLEHEIRELRRANSDLKELDRLKSDFISIASHELRTPLVTIIGYLGLLSEKRLGDIPEEQMRIIKVIERNAKKLEKIVKDIFTLSLIENKIPFMEIRNVNLIKTTELVLEDFALIFAQRELTTNLHINGEIPMIEGDQNKIAQVITNLVSNAVKYTDNNGKIDVTLNYPSEKAEYKYGLKNEDYVDVLVQDTGIGIPPEKLNVIFEKFIELSDIENHHTSDNEFMGSGTGLGLSISMGVIKRHNGYIWAENRKEQGTVIIVVLPIKNNANYI